ncbi:MAG: GxxExxY protein [bacterium]
MQIRKQIDLPVVYKEVIELKTVVPIHESQILIYLKMMDKRLGLLINFNVSILKDRNKRRPINFKFFSVPLRLCG